MVLNLAVFDDLRIAPSARTFTKPQHLSSLVAVVVIAAALVAFRHVPRPGSALVVAWIEITAFVFFHVIPVESGPSKPVVTHGGRVQWVGLLSILRRQRRHRPRFRAALARLAPPHLARPPAPALRSGAPRSRGKHKW